MRQRGFAPILIVIILALAGIGIAGFFNIGGKLEGTPPTPIEVPDTSTPQSIVTATPIPTVLPTPIATIKPVSTTSLLIKGDENCKTRTREALNLLQSKAPIHYQTVIKYIGVIECVEKGSGMYAWEDPPRFQVGRLTYESGAIWYAGGIVHDACHSKLYVESKVPWTGADAEKMCSATQYDALEKIGADSATLEYLKGTIDSKYWEVSPEDRWW